MDLHALPRALQRCQSYVYVIGWVPLQVPGSAVRTCPTCAAPEIVGEEVLTGLAAAATSALPASASEKTTRVAQARARVLARVSREMAERYDVGRATTECNGCAPAPGGRTTVKLVLVRG